MLKKFEKIVVILQLCTSIATSMDYMEIEEEIGCNSNSIQNNIQNIGYNNNNNIQNNIQSIGYNNNNNIQNNSIDKVFKIKYMNRTRQEDLNNRTIEPTIIAVDKKEMRTLYTLLKQSEDTRLKNRINTNIRCGFNQLYENKMFSDKVYKEQHNELFSWIQTFNNFNINNNKTLNITQINGILLLTKMASLMQQPNKKSVFTSIPYDERYYGMDHSMRSCNYPHMTTTLFKINFIKNSLNNFFSTDKQSKFGEHSKICIIPETFYKFLDAIELCSNCKLLTTIKDNKQEKNINQFVITHEDYKSFLDVLIKNFIVNLLQLCNDSIETFLFPSHMLQEMKNIFCKPYDNVAYTRNKEGLISFFGKDCIDNITYVLYKRVCADKKYSFINIMKNFNFFNSFLKKNINSLFINNENLYDIDNCLHCPQVQQYIKEEQSKISNVFGTIFNEMKELLSSNDNKIINEIRNEWSEYCNKYTINNLVECFKKEKEVACNFPMYLNKILTDRSYQYFFFDIKDYINKYEIALRNTDIGLKLISTRKLLNDGKDNAYIYNNVINKPFFKILPRRLCFTIASYIPYNRLCYRLFNKKNFVMLGIYDVDDNYNILKIDENNRKERVIPLLRNIQK